MSNIEERLQKFSGTEFVKSNEHTGGGWFVSVTTGFACIDIRKFFMPLFGFEEKPAESGFAFRLTDWSAFRAAVSPIDNDQPQLSNALPCGNHPNQQEAFQCREC